MRIPLELDGVTPAWLTGALRSTGVLGQDESVVGVEPGEAAGGIAVTGLVSRLALDVSPRSSRAPRSMFIKLPRPDRRDHFEGCQLEYRFYRELAARFRLPVPGCLYAELDVEDRRCVLLLEDLSHADPGHPIEGCDESQARRVMLELARVHARCWESEALRGAGWSSAAHDPERAGIRLSRRCSSARRRFFFGSGGKRPGGWGCTSGAIGRRD